MEGDNHEIQAKNQRMIDQLLKAYMITVDNKKIQVKDRFQIFSPLGKGTYGQVFCGKHKYLNIPICIKVNKYEDVNLFEYNVLHDLKEAGYHEKGFPEVFGHGRFCQYSFIIMKQMGKTLQDFI